MDTADYEKAVELMRERLQAVEPIKSYDRTPSPEKINELATLAIDDYFEPQIAYFHDQAEKREGWESRTHRISPYCFFISVVCALIHFALDASEHLPIASGEEHVSMGATEHVSTHQLSYFSVGLLFVAAAAPVVGAVVRTIRSAHEFGRNATRFRTVKKQLTTIKQQLQNPNLELDLRIMWFVRGVWLLETEQLAWMRLMHEAEWFG